MASEHPKENGQNADGNSAPTSGLEFLQSLGAATGVLAGLAFISGWLYWTTYYTAFGLNSLVLNLPFSVVSVSLVQVLVRDLMSECHWMKVILLLAVAAVLALTAGFFYWFKQRRRHWAATLAGILALGMLVGSWFLGYHDAALDGGCRSRLPAITFESIAPTDQAGLACQVGSTDSCLLVLHINNAYHYFVAPEQGVCAPILSGSPCASEPPLLSLPGTQRTGYEISDAQVRIASIHHYKGW